MVPGARPVSEAVTGVAVDPESGEGVAAIVGGELDDPLLYESATKTSPAASTATAEGLA